MCDNRDPVDFSDLEDAEWKTMPSVLNKSNVLDKDIFTVAAEARPNPYAKPAKPAFVENCGDCGGTGKFYSYSGRLVGKCFKCDGTGKLTFKTSAVDRAKAKQAAVAKKKAVNDRAMAFLTARPDVKKWFDDNDGRWDFATSLHDSLMKYGQLTEAQLAAIERNIAKNASRVAAQPTSGLDLSKVPSGYYAVPEGDTRLKIRIDNVTEGKWAGWVFVKDGAYYGEGKRYGSQRPGSSGYLGEIVDALRIVASNPADASKAYGRLVGRCGVCGRTLEDENSVAEGIGPHCQGKMGW